MSAGAIFITIAVAMFPALILVAVAVKLMEIRRASRWPQTTGKVVACRVQARTREPDDVGYASSDTEVSNQPYVEYEYTVGGTTHRCARVTIGESIAGSEVESVLKRYPVGKTVTVYYDPANPDRALLERNLPLGIMTAGLGCVMAFFVGGPVLGVLLYTNALHWLGTHLADPTRAPIVAVLGLFTLATTYFALAYTSYSRRPMCWPATRGRIIQSEVVPFFAWRDADDTVGTRLRYRPRVVYEYTVNNHVYQGDRLRRGLSIWSTAPGLAQRVVEKYPVGMSVDVHHDPESPGESVLQPYTRIYVVPWLAVLALGAFAWALATGRI